MGEDLNPPLVGIQVYEKDEPYDECPRCEQYKMALKYQFRGPGLLAILVLFLFRREYEYEKISWKECNNCKYKEEIEVESKTI